MIYSQFGSTCVHKIMEWSMRGSYTSFPIAIRFYPTGSSSGIAITEMQNNYAVTENAHQGRSGLLTSC